ncbi:MAG: hypothetical protein ABSA49_14925 [Rhizomicrobium sp.]
MVNDFEPADLVHGVARALFNPVNRKARIRSDSWCNTQRVERSTLVDL